MSKMKSLLAANIRRLIEIGLDADDIVKVTGYSAEVVQSALTQETARR